MGQAGQSGSTCQHICELDCGVGWAELSYNTHRYIQEPVWDAALTRPDCCTYWHVQEPRLGAGLVGVIGGCPYQATVPTGVPNGQVCGMLGWTGIHHLLVCMQCMIGDGTDQATTITNMCIG